MKQIDVNEVYMLFEEIKEQIKKVNENHTIDIQPQMEIPDLSEISNLTAKLDDVIGEVRKPVKTEHRHIFSFESNKIFFSVIGVSLALLISLFVIYFQQEKLSNYKDNDLKYRYTKMKGEIAPAELNLLENLFENKRDSVKIIHKQVKKYEKAVVEKAKRLEKVRLKEQEAERLKKEAENLKQQK